MRYHNINDKSSMKDDLKELIIIQCFYIKYIALNYNLKLCTNCYKLRTSINF